MGWDLKLGSKQLLSFRSLSGDSAFSLSNPSTDFLNIVFGQSETTSGEVINQETALKFSAVFSGTDLIAKTIAALSFNVIEYQANGNQNIQYGHSLHYLLHTEPHPHYTSYWFRHMLISLTILWGDGYAEIIRGTNYNVIGFKLHHPRLVTTYMSGEEIYHKIDGREEPIADADMIHLMFWSDNGLTGKSLISMAGESIGTGTAMQKFSARFFKNGANLKTVLESDHVLKDEVYKRIKQSWREEQEGAENSFNTPILEQGLKAKSIGVSPEDAQLISSRKFQISEVARYLHIPLHKLADLEKATNNNIEHQGIEFVQETILPWSKQIELEFNRKIFRERERGKVATRLNIDSLLRGDTAARIAYAQGMWNMGAWCANDVLRSEGMNTFEGGDQHFVQSGFVPVEMAGKGFEESLRKKIESELNGKD